jgi:hypothetical protein
MEVEYRIEPRDLAALRKFREAETGNKKRSRWGEALAWVGILGILALAMAMKWQWLYYAFVGAMVGFFAGLFYSVWLWRRGMQTIGEVEWETSDKPGTPPRRLAVTPEGVSMTTHQTRYFVTWSKICRIEETDDHVFLFENKFSAIVAPARAFPNRRAFEDFADLVRKYRKQAEAPQGITAAPPSSPAPPNTDITT